jgi:Uma2 family endonuclease
MGENTIQVKWIINLFNGLEAVFRDRPDVFVAADLFWYPVHGDPTTVTAPDVMVVIGRPKGDRGSYKRWEEGNVAPQVVFEVLSPSNTTQDRDDKLEHYRRYGVSEYYEYDPYGHVLRVWTRHRKQLVPVADVNGFVSPHLGLRFEVSGAEPMKVFDPNGKPFRSYLELLADAEAQQQAEAKRRRAEESERRAEALAAKLRELGVDPDQV